MPLRRDADLDGEADEHGSLSTPDKEIMEAATLNNEVSRVREELFSLIESVEREARNGSSSESNAELSELATTLQDVANRLGLVESQCRDLD
jgi:hypothetical protein